MVCLGLDYNRAYLNLGYKVCIKVTTKKVYRCMYGNGYGYGCGCGYGYVCM
jgi:hypothetical protein